jgi:hypothetical protein
MLIILGSPVDSTLWSQNFVERSQDNLNNLASSNHPSFRT